MPKSTTPSNTRGGKREGAGRPPSEERRERHEITLTSSEWALLKEGGNGNASYAISALLIGGSCPHCGKDLEAIDIIPCSST